MHLVVKKNGGIINEFRFDRGPIYLGRHAHSQILLPDLTVSRQHAAIFNTQDGKWMVEDMDSANTARKSERPKSRPGTVSVSRILLSRSISKRKQTPAQKFILMIHSHLLPVKQVLHGQNRLVKLS